LGVIAYNTLTAATSGGTTTELIAVTCTATLDVSRQYKIKTTPFHPQSTVAGDFVNVFLRQSTAGGSVSISSTQIGQAICTCPTANGIRDTKAIETLLVAPTTGTYQFGITFIRISPATGTVTLNQAPTSRVLALMVEDCGPALAAVSP
jgi:tripartite-type tricarboxylate transporter receptor subunit TctC